jgi:hypothetical protein
MMTSYEESWRRLRRRETFVSIVGLIVTVGIVIGGLAYSVATMPGAREDPFSMNRMYAGACIKAINAMEHGDIDAAEDHLRRALERSGYACAWQEWGDERYFECSRDK